MLLLCDIEQRTTSDMLLTSAAIALAAALLLGLSHAAAARPAAQRAVAKANRTPARRR